MPTSTLTATTRSGWIPAATVYTASLPTEMAIPLAPQSPIPKISWASDTTIRSTSSGPRPSPASDVFTSWGRSTDR